MFRWAAADGTQAGDSWQWRRTDNGDEQRTTDTSLTVPPPDGCASRSG